MAQKIEGWASLNEFEDGHPRFQREAFRGQDEPYRPSVLVISDTDQPPVVFTESEVKAIAMQAINMIKSAKKDNIHVGQACGYIGKACIDAGIILDPS